MGSKAEATLGTLEQGVLRALFLFVGQGEATLLWLPSGQGHLTMLIDCNRDTKLGGIDLARLLVDLLPRDGRADKRRLDYFVNTHPHKDHLGGLAEIREAVNVGTVWHSGHRPGREYDGPFEELKKLIASVEKAGGEVLELTGSRTPMSVGDTEINVLAPAEHVTDDIDGEDATARYNRIHEQCAVLRVGYGVGSAKVRMLITGDSDKKAWKEHIAYHHKPGNENRVASQILSASHHGSRTFFKTNEDDAEPYVDHLSAINPTYLVISAPSQAESPHGHPHDDALKLYKTVVKEANILHMSSGKSTFIAEIRPNGTFSIRSDRGSLAKDYSLSENPDASGGGSQRRPTIEVLSRVDRSYPMGMGPKA